MLILSYYLLKQENSPLIVKDKKTNLLILLRVTLVGATEIMLCICYQEVKVSKVIIIENMGPIFIIFLNFFILN